MLVACTIVSKNYLPFARVLADSFLEQHPEARFVTLLVDRIDGYFDPAAERFEVIPIEALGDVPDLSSFLFKYSLLEANTAIKPFFLEHLFARSDVDHLVYLDPDIWVHHPLTDALERLERCAIVLTPHLTAPIDDDAHPGELAILQSGAYNLGFVALRRGDTSARLLRWWRSRLYEGCVVRIDQGLFVDQKWMDLAPGLFPEVAVLTHPGYNVAYWNLHDRELRLTSDGATVNGRPLVFFHFSGIEPEALHGVSKHQDRYTLAEIGEAAELYRRYRDRLVASGSSETRAWPYAFGAFDNGVRIPETARRLYYDLGERRAAFGDPFAVGGRSSFFAWLKAPAARGRGRSPYLSRLLRHVCEVRPDLLRSFPEPGGRDLPRFSSWLTDYGRYELGLDEAWLTDLHRESRATLLTWGGLHRRLGNRLRRLYGSGAGRRARTLARRLLGAERARRVRGRLRPARTGPAGDGAPDPWPARLPAELTDGGVNLLVDPDLHGPYAEAVLALTDALQRTEIPVRHFEASGPAGRVEAGALAHGINVLCLPPENAARWIRQLDPAVLAGRYNVGYALAGDAPPGAGEEIAVDLCHELWATDGRTCERLADTSPVPVRRVPLPVGSGGAEDEQRSLGRAATGSALEVRILHILRTVRRRGRSGGGVR